MSRIADVLAALRAERQDLLNEVSRIDRAIAALEDAAGPGLIAAAAAAANYPADAYGRRPGPYSMLRVAEAAAIYLAEAGVPKTSTEIAAALRAGGVRTTSTPRTFTDTVQKMLRKSGAEFGIRHTSDYKRWFVQR